MGLWVCGRVLLKRGEGGMRGINVAHHAQVVDKGGKAGTGLVITEQLGLVATGGKRVKLGKGGVLDGGAGHGEHTDIQQRVG